MKVFENENGKVFYTKGAFQVKIKGLVGLVECADYESAINVLNGDNPEGTL